jgi:AraC-like DNA-binding protein
MPPTDRGFLVGLSLGVGHRRRIFHANHSSVHDFAQDAVYVRNFADAYRADLIGPLDFLLLEVSRGLLDRIADEEGGLRRDGLSAQAGISDPVLGHLLRALMPALARPGEASALFLEHLAVAIGVHLLHRYGGAGAAVPARRGLSAAHARRAKEMLRQRLDGTVSIAEVAAACGLSRSYFIAAFRLATGQTPHQWLTACRVARARELLSASTLPLAEVAAACGFADQSHFSRVFVHAVGAPPGQWRRHAPNLPGVD